MVHQLFTLSVTASSTDELQGALVAIRECRALIAEHVDRCEVEVSDIAIISE